MIATILGLVNQYWKYAAFVGLVIFYNVHVHELDVRYAAARVAAVDAAYQRGSDEARAAAAAAAARESASYSAALAAAKEKYEQDLANISAAHAADTERLRQLAAASDRRADGVLASARAGAAASGGGGESAGGLGSVPAQLGLELADALRQDDAALRACYVERDSLTGK